MKIKLAVIIGFTFLIIGCKKTDNEEHDSVKSIELLYISPYHLYPYRIGCMKTFVREDDESMFFYKNITSGNFIEQFDTIYSQLKALENTNYDFDARIQMLVHKQHTTDTVCMSRNTHIVINGVQRKNNPDFFKLIDILIAQDLKDRE
ncbi:hypothetical protein GN157_12420 [Flavobacterium rakeshii]|uniref:Uncharacterized protein n=1 Tax=Flavobacterium rakeshii TaxID=1038845 RepID=A0A6N8HFL1_9FLAO|nr:hypothetical protein [Flavobacterium rakeshii]MEE1900105.1 hypothetical protein [Flavobacterium rakeshii]MUV04515.1 hypothetical protein [Flavobacterium rakeshii]